MFHEMEALIFQSAVLRTLKTALRSKAGSTKFRTIKRIQSSIDPKD